MTTTLTHFLWIIKAWSQEQSYYSKIIDDADKFSVDYTVGQVLKDKQKFKYVFDFGAEWLFQCGVLRIEDRICDTGDVIRSVGEPSEQYYFDF